MSNHSEHFIQIVEVGGVAIKLVGNSAILQQPLLGLFCSQKCPGELILKAYDVAKQLREQGRVVVSGFIPLSEKTCCLSSCAAINRWLCAWQGTWKVTVFRKIIRH